MGLPADLLLAWGEGDSPEVKLSRRAASGQLEEIARLTGDALPAGGPRPELSWKEGEVVASLGGRALTPSAKVSWKTTRAGYWSLGQVEFGELRVVGVLSRNWLREELRKAAPKPPPAETPAESPSSPPPETPTKPAPSPPAETP
jgi:hypothetical protein